MNLVKSTGTFGFYTIISRILGYLRDVLIAIFLGTSFLADAFFVAFRIPNTFRRLFTEGTFNSAFVPSYTEELVKKNSKSTKSGEAPGMVFSIPDCIKDLQDKQAPFKDLSVTVKLCVSVPVELYTVLSDPQNLAKNPGQKSGTKSGHADQLSTTGL